MGSDWLRAIEHGAPSKLRLIADDHSPDNRTIIPFRALRLCISFLKPRPVPQPSSRPTAQFLPRTYRASYPGELPLGLKLSATP